MDHNTELQYVRKTAIQDAERCAQAQRKDYRRDNSAGRIADALDDQCVPLASATHVGHEHLEHPERWEIGDFGIRRGSRGGTCGAQMRPIDDLGDLMTWEEFLGDVDGGMLIDYDGFGELATSDRVSTIEVNPSGAQAMTRPAWATHVVWYNR